MFHKRKFNKQPAYDVSSNVIEVLKDHCSDCKLEIEHPCCINDLIVEWKDSNNGKKANNHRGY